MGYHFHRPNFNYCQGSSLLCDGDSHENIAIVVDVDVDLDLYAEVDVDDNVTLLILRV